MTIALTSQFIRSEQRCEPRFAVALPATAVINGKDHSIRLLNVALGGVMFETSALLEGGTKLVFRSGTIDALATVAWQTRQGTGVIFERRLSDRDVRDQISRNSAVALRREAKHRK